jgi:hypothetical protein
MHNRGFIGSLIVILLALFLALFAIGFFQSKESGHSLFSFEQVINLDCGLNVYSPKADKKVTFPKRVYGYANGCGWNPEGSVIGTLDVLDSRGLLIGSFDISQTENDTDQPYFFDIVITVPVPAFEDRGLFIFRNNSSTDQKIVTIPVSFR